MYQLKGWNEVAIVVLVEQKLACTVREYLDVIVALDDFDRIFLGQYLVDVVVQQRELFEYLVSNGFLYGTFQLGDAGHIVVFEPGSWRRKWFRL